MPPVGTENQPMQCGARAKTTTAPRTAPTIANENCRRAGGGPAGEPPALRSSALLHILLRELLFGIEVVRHIASRPGRLHTAEAQPAVVVAVGEIDHHSDAEPDAETPPRFLGKVLCQEDARQNAEYRQKPRTAG